MNLKKTIPIAFLCLSFLPVILLAIFTFAPVNADLYYSFENGFENKNDGTTPLISYGNMAFTEHGASGRAIDLKDGHLTIKNSERFVLKKQFTYSLWIKFNDLTSDEPAIIRCGDAFKISFAPDFESLKAILTFNNNDNSLKSHTFDSGYLTSSGRLVKGWHHIAVVFNENYLTFYLDGEPKKFETLPKEFESYRSLFHDEAAFDIGIGLTKPINAILDEIYFKNSASTADEIMKLYQNTKPKQEAEMVFTANQKIATLNGVQQELSTKVIVDEKTGEVLIPAKSVIDFLGGSIAWDGEDNFGRADITVGNDTLTIWLYDSHALINGNYYKLKTHPITPDEVLAIPASVLADAFGAEINWSDTSQRLTILY